MKRSGLYTLSEWHLLVKVYFDTAWKVILPVPAYEVSPSVVAPQIAKVEKLKPLEVELRRLEDLSESIVNDFAYMKKREEEMRDTNGKRTTKLVIKNLHVLSVWHSGGIPGMSKHLVSYLRVLAVP